MLYERRDFRETLREVTGGAGLPVVYESVGKDTFQRSLECLRPRGILANFGHASGPPDLVELIELGTRGLLWVTRPTIMTYMEDRDDMVAKGLSWALRELSVRDRHATIQFLDRHGEALAARVRREVQNKLRTGFKNPGRGR